MVFRRGRRSRRPAKRRRFNRRRRRTFKRFRRKKMDFLQVKMQYYAPSIQFNHLATDPVLGSAAFDITQVPNYSVYTNLFDLFRIVKAKIEFINMGGTNTTYPNVTGELVAGSGTIQTQAIYNQTPQIATCIDVNDSQPAVSVNSILQRSGSRHQLLKNRHSRTFVPAISTPVYRGSGSTFAYTPAYKKWLDTVTPGCLHYGVKFAVYAPVGTFQESYTTINTVVTLWVQFKRIIQLGVSEAAVPEPKDSTGDAQILPAQEPPF